MYTVQFAEHETAVAFKTRLEAKLPEDGRFTVRTVEVETETLGPIASKKRAPKVFVYLHTIRRAKRGDYCGQHPGPCAAVVPRKITRGFWLEWDDWITFHSLVNDILDEMAPAACAWSVPNEGIPMYPGQGKKFWIRKDGKRRQRYDWDEDPTYHSFFGAVRRRWDMGSASQFEAEEGGGDALA